MGDISSHSLIVRDVRDHMRRFLPDEDYFFLEFGNFLTDVSQFRDPTAMFSAKTEIYQQAISNLGILRHSVLAESLVNSIVRDYANDLLGTRQNRHGALSTYFRQIIFGASLQSAYRAGIDLDETERIFFDNFTQYYPHEHLDFPPIRSMDDLGRHRLYRRGRRHLVGYLEEFIQYVSEQLSLVEDHWKPSILYGSPEDRDRHDVLAAFGHVLHAIEDFYFHSNFAEIQWLLHRRSAARADPGEMTYDPDHDWESWFVDEAMRGRPATELATRYKRAFYRRLRFPSRTAWSEEGSSLVYTGGFAKTDILHTFYRALSSLEEHFATVGLEPLGHGSGLVLFENVFSEANRQKLVDEEGYIDHVISAHKRQLDSTDYQDWIDRHTGLGPDKLHPRTANAFLLAYEIDKAVTREHSDTPGLGGFVIELTRIVQEEARASARRSRRLDRQSPALVSIADNMTANGSSAEQIGTHSLLSKDTRASIPFRREAMALARAASLSIAGIMAQEVVDPAHFHERVWWDEIVRHFLRYPRTRRIRWERQVLASARQDRDLDVTRIQDRPQIRRLPRSNEHVEQRLRDETRVRLESRYRSLEEHADSRWEETLSGPARRITIPGIAG